MFKKLSLDLILLHFCFVGLFLIIPSVSFVRPQGESYLALTKIFMQDTTSNFVLLCFFYLNYYLLLPKYFFARKYFFYTLFTILFLASAFALPYYVGRFFPHEIRDHENNVSHSIHHFQHFHNHSFSLISFVFEEFRRHLGLFFTAIFFSFLLRTRQDLAKLKEDKFNAELSSLKSQINPHFLFNTLNSIYSLSLKKDDRVSDAIINLSGLMRYVIKEANDNKIPLQKEIDYLSNYIELMRARLGNTVTIDFQISGYTGSLEIAPLILITFIENAFKYGVNPDIDECIVEIKIQISDNSLLLFVYNKKVPISVEFNSTGIGIINTKERLKLLYRDKHRLEINENKNNYSVTLSLVMI